MLPVSPTAVGPTISLDLDVDDVEMENYEVGGCTLLLLGGQGMGLPAPWAQPSDPPALGWLEAQLSSSGSKERGLASSLGLGEPCMELGFAAGAELPAPALRRC